MNAAGNIVTIALLACLAVQDFRSRSISAWLLPAIMIGMLLPPCSTQEVQLLVYPNFLVNFSLLLFQFVCLWLFVSVRSRKWTNIINTQVGTGDILLLVCLTPFFSPLNFFVLFTFAIIFALVSALLMRALSKARSEHIPFAGLFAIPLILLCALRIVFPQHILFSSDEWLDMIVLA